MPDLTMVRVKKEVLKKAKVQATKEEVSLQAWVERALILALKKK